MPIFFMIPSITTFHLLKHLLEFSVLSSHQHGFHQSLGRRCWSISFHKVDVITFLNFPQVPGELTYSQYKQRE